MAIGYGLETYPGDPLLQAHGMRWHYASGRVDQADLAGVLNALYDQRLPLISVEYFDSEGSEIEQI